MRLGIISWMFRLMILRTIHQEDVEGRYEWARGWYVWGGWAAAMPWLDLTSVTLMAFVFAATPKEEQMSPSPLHTHSSDFIIKLKRADTLMYVCTVMKPHPTTSVQNAQDYGETGVQQVYRYSLLNEVWVVWWPQILYVISLAELRQCNEWDTLNCPFFSPPLCPPHPLHPSMKKKSCGNEC